DHQHGAGLSGGTVDRVLLDPVDPRIRQQRNVEFGGLLGLAVEPQAGGYFGHRQALLRDEVDLRTSDQTSIRHRILEFFGFSVIARSASDEAIHYALRT